jgi:HSP20 family protein
MMLMRTDPFRDLDRLTQQMLGTTARPAVMAMDAWRTGDKFVVEFDLPGIEVNSIDLSVERNVLTVRADRRPQERAKEMIAAERPRGLFSRQLMLGDTLETENVGASYQDGVLRLEFPIAEAAKPRKITVTSIERDSSDRPTNGHSEVPSTSEQSAVDA